MKKRLTISHKPLVIGYTLIEILVAMTIVGLIFGIGYVSFRDFARRQALSGVARSVRGDLRLAQEQALAGKKPDSVSCNDPNTLSGYYFDRVSAGVYRIMAQCSAGDTEVKNVDLPADISLSISSSPLIFKILGQGTNIPSGGQVTITLTQFPTSSTREILVTPGGEIK